MTRTRSIRRLVFALFLGTILGTAACTKGPAYGSANAIIAVVDSALMSEIEPILTASLERDVHTTRRERVFEVTFTTPESIGEFTKWKRLVVVEPLDDASLVPDLVDVPEDGRVVAEVEDEWARDQTIWVFAAGTPEATVELVRQRADSLYEVIHERFAEQQTARMWASERDSALYRSLIDSLGFGIVLPRVYRAAPQSAPADSRVWYNQDPRRIVSLHWTEAPAEVTIDTVLALRRAWGREVFPEDSIVGALPGATVDAANDTAGGVAGGDTAAADTAGVAANAGEPSPIQASRTTVSGRPAVRLQGVWRSTTEMNAGIFLTYGITCGDSLVLFDGNVFAPDREKYPYVLQLERIVSTFHCARE